MTDIDFINSPWWITVSGAGTTVSGTTSESAAAMPSWANDYTRHRSGGLASTYTTVDDLIGRTKTGRELDKTKV